ncbi:hypothetical protein ACPCIY_17610, partial [Streptomyces thermodiastaticus]
MITALPNRLRCAAPDTRKFSLTNVHGRQPVGRRMLPRRRGQVRSAVRVQGDEVAVRIDAIA